MAIISHSRVSRLKALIIDDLPAMRANLRAQLQQLGIGDVEQASSARDALKVIAARSAGQPFGLVLCDYNLGGGTNGQQLLEHVRAKNLLQPVTVWFMVTAEGGYDNVASASDYAPDDYLIKPFTAANLESRLLRHFERQDALEPGLKRMAEGDLDGAAAEFDRIALSGSKFTMDALRMKARCYTERHRHDEAKAVFAQALSIRRQVPWAELGMARALRDTGEIDKAMAAATAIAAANPALVGAHELLADLHQARGDEAAALEELSLAESLVPSPKRTRVLGEMAVRAGNMDVAREAYSKVVASTRNSITKTPYDNAALAQVYVETGETASALETLKSVKQEFGGETAFHAIAAAVEARAHLANADAAAAHAALERALDLAKNADPAAALAVSRACFALGKDAEGESLVARAVRANHEDAKLVAAARKVLRDSGREDVTDRLIDAQLREMLEMTEKALALAKQAQIDAAQATIAEAVAGLPRNVGVLVAAAQINLLSLSQNGLDAAVITRVRGYLATLETLAPGTERVVKMQEFFSKLLDSARPGGGR